MGFGAGMNVALLRLDKKLAAVGIDNLTTKDFTESGKDSITALYNKGFTLEEVDGLRKALYSDGLAPYYISDLALFNFINSKLGINKVKKEEKIRQLDIARKAIYEYYRYTKADPNACYAIDQQDCYIFNMRNLNKVPGGFDWIAEFDSVTDLGKYNQCAIESILTLPAVWSAIEGTKPDKDFYELELEVKSAGLSRQILRRLKKHGFTSLWQVNNWADGYSDSLLSQLWILTGLSEYQIDCLRTELKYRMDKSSTSKPTLRERLAIEEK